MIDDLRPSLRVLGRDAGIEVRIDIDGSIDTVLAERIQFQQAVINLVRNAVEAAAGARDPVVVVRGRRVSDGYRISVEDNGPGVPANDLDAVMRPLTTSKANGMGLGLSVTRTIVESHGGSLRLDRSALGGAAFSICLPQEERAA